MILKEYKVRIQMIPIKLGWKKEGNDISQSFLEEVTVVTLTINDSVLFKTLSNGIVSVSTFLYLN